MITFPVADGTAPGYLALPQRGAGARGAAENAGTQFPQAPTAAGEGPGILLLHAWWGLNSFFQATCDRLAREGFVVLAPDLYHGQVAATIEEAERLHAAFDGKGARAEIAGAVAYLRQHPAVKGQGIGCIGFSMGAEFAFATSCAMPADIAAVVVFYGAGPVADYTAARAAYLGHYAPGDEWEPDEYVSQTEATLRAAGRDVTFYRYPGAGHWFVEENRPDAYNPEAAQLAWQRTLGFLHRHLAQA